METNSVHFYFRLIVEPQVDRGDELKRAGGVGALQQEDPEVLGCPECGGGPPQVSQNLNDEAIFLSAHIGPNILKDWVPMSLKIGSLFKAPGSVHPNLEHF